MSGFDEFLIGACFKERPLSKLPWESLDGKNSRNQERKGSPEKQQHHVDVVKEKAWNDWSSDTKQPEEHSNYGLQSSVDDGSIVSKEFGDEIIAKVTLGELSMTEIVYGHGYKAKSEPKEPVDENKIVDLGFEDAFTRGNLDTSCALQSDISNRPSFLRETSSYSAQSKNNLSCLDSTGLGISISSATTSSAIKDNIRKIVDVGFRELPNTLKSSLDKMSSSNKIVDVGLDQLGYSYSDDKLSAKMSQSKAMPWVEKKWESKQMKNADSQIEFQNGGLYTAQGPYVPSAFSSTIINRFENAYSYGNIYKTPTLKPDSDSSCFDKTTSLSACKKQRATIANDLDSDQYDTFRPDIKARFENSIGLANPSTGVSYVPSFSNRYMSDRKTSDTNIISLCESKYVGVKNTSPRISSSYSGPVPNIKPDSFVSFNDLRNASNKTTDQSVEILELQQEQCKLNAPKSKQNPQTNSCTAEARTSTVNPVSNCVLPKVPKVIVVEPEHIQRERRMKKLIRNNESFSTDNDDEVIRYQNVSNTQSNTLSGNGTPVRTLMVDVRSQYVSRTDDDVEQLNEEVASSRGSNEEDHADIDNKIKKTYKQIVNSIKSLCSKKESKKSSSKRIKCGTKHCAAKRKVSFAKLDTFPNANEVNDLCKCCERELSGSPTSHTTQNKSAAKQIHTDNKELEIARQRLGCHGNGPIPSDVYYQLIDIVEGYIGVEQRKSLMASTFIAKPLDMIHGRSENIEREVNDMDNYKGTGVTEEKVDFLVDRNQLKIRYNSVKDISEQSENTDGSYEHDTENVEANTYVRKTSKGRQLMDFMKSLFCCKRKNNAVDVDD